MYRLKELRLDKGLKQSELANILMTTQATIGKYERGDLEPNLDFLKKLADFFEVSTDYLLGREDDFGVIQTKSPGESFTREERQLVEDYRALAPDLQEMIRATIQTWKGTEANEERKRKQGIF